MPSLEDMKTWRDRLERSGLRSFTDELDRTAPATTVNGVTWVPE